MSAQELEACEQVAKDLEQLTQRLEQGDAVSTAETQAILERSRNLTVGGWRVNANAPIQGQDYGQRVGKGDSIIMMMPFPNQ